MKCVHKRLRADSDLGEIWNYIAEDSIQHANTLLDMFDQKFQMLAERPNIGKLRDELGKDVRSFPFGKYSIFYRPVSDGIEVLRVLHGARDLETIFEQAPSES